MLNHVWVKVYPTCMNMNVQAVFQNVMIGSFGTQKDICKSNLTEIRFY